MESGWYIYTGGKWVCGGIIVWSSIVLCTYEILHVRVSQRQGRKGPYTGEKGKNTCFAFVDSLCTPLDHFYVLSSSQ